MHSNNDNYDFLCGNDSKFVTIAIKNDLFHTVTIQADAAKTIDFAGGTRNVEEILLSRCLKMSQIHWPANTGAIKRLRICFADTLAKLDLTALTSLEELSIIDCAQLTEIIGIPPSLKQLNIHGASMTTLDVSACENLETYNVVTLADQFHAELSNLNRLHSIYLAAGQLENRSGIINCVFNHCHALRLLAIETPTAQTHLTIQFCPNIQTMYLHCGKESELTGLANCLKLDFVHIEHINSMAIDPIGKRLLKKIQSGTSTHTASLTTKDKLTEIKQLFSEFRPAILQPKPGPEDIETVIQQNASPREKNGACEVKISLLGLPAEATEQHLQHDFNRRRTLLLADELRGHLSSRHKLIYYLDEHSGAMEIQSQLVTARIPEEDEQAIIQWLENKDQRHPNILRLDEKSLFIPSVNEFLSTFTPHRKLLIHRNQYYRLTPAHKIVANIALKPFIEHFTTRRALPLTLAEQNQFLHATLTSHHLIHQADKSAAAALLPARQLRSVISQFLSALKATSDNAGLISTHTPANPSITSSMSSSSAAKTTAAAKMAGTLAPAAEKDQQLASKPARSSYAARSKSKSAAANLTIRSSGLTGRLTDDQDDDMLHSTPVKSNHSRRAAPIPSSFTNEDTPHKQQGKIISQYESDPIHGSAHIHADYQAGIPHQTVITSPSAAKSQQYSTHTLPTGQHATLDRDNEPVNANLSSARINVSHEAAAASQQLLDTSKDLAEAIKQVAVSAKSAVLDNDQLVNSFDSAADVLDNVINDISLITVTSAEHANNDTLQRRLDAATNLIDAVRRLNLACDQLHAISQPASGLPNLSALQHKQKEAVPAERHETDQRQMLIDMLTNAQEIFIANNRAKNLSEGMFGTGFKAGVNNMRLEILNSILQALEDHQVLKSHEVKQSLKEIMKDPYLKSALAGQSDLIEAYLTTGHSPRHNQVDPAKD